MEGNELPRKEKGLFLKLATPLGDGKFLRRLFSGHDGISQLSHFRLDMLSEDSAINFDGMIGQNVRFSVPLADPNKTRYFNGYVGPFTLGGNFAKVNWGGVFIKGSMVMIKNGGAAGSGAGSTPTAPSHPMEVGGSAPTQSASPPLQPGQPRTLPLAQS